MLGAVPPEAAGQASGANNAIRELGGVFGVAAMTTVFATYGSYESGEAFTDGLTPAVWIGAAIVACGAVVALFVQGKKRKQAPEVIPTVVIVPERHLLGSGDGSEAEMVFHPAIEPGEEPDAFP